jgi:hypothetical protein
MKGETLFQEDKSDLKELAKRIRQEATNRSVKIHNIIVDEDGVG